MGDYFGLSGWAQYKHKSTSVKEAAVSELVAVDMKIQHEVGVMQKGAMSQAMHTAFRR